MTHSKDRTKVPVSRLVIGMTVLVAGFLSPLAIPLVASSGLPPRWAAAISGFLLFGIPEIFMLFAIAIMGRESFDFLKQKLAAWLRKLAPPDEVSLLRYRFGLLLFCLIVMVCPSRFVTSICFLRAKRFRITTWQMTMKKMMKT